MDNSHTGLDNEAELVGASPEAEATAIRIVSNLPAALQRGTPDALQAKPSGGVDDDARGWDDGSEEWDEDDDEDIDVDELEEDMAELAEDLDHAAWDDMPVLAGFPENLHGSPRPALHPERCT